MASIPLAPASLSQLKNALLKELPDVRSSHVSEALACAMGFRTHAALLAALKEQTRDPNILLLDDDLFDTRLQALGYLTDQEFSFELLDKSDCPDLISTIPVSGYDLEYRSVRKKAWRNLMILTINAGLQQKLFSVRPYDNRWLGAAPQDSLERGKGYVFDFVLPGGEPVRGFVSDAGFGELSIHAAVRPRGDWVRAFNAGFDAGDAFACGWLERDKGAWLQSSPDQFNCRKPLLSLLAGLDAHPIGYGDRGRVIM